MQKKNIIFKKTSDLSINERDVEIVERKGIGHPDDICDNIAEEISVRYSKYCLENFGHILRHMIDKISVTGGLTKVQFGGGELVTPAKIHLKGRFTDSVGDIKIPYREISEGVIYDYFKKVYNNFSKDQIVIENNTHFSPGPGIIFDKNNDSKNERKVFFLNQTKETLQYHNNGLRSNDTSTVVCYYPLSDLESAILDVEKHLNSSEIKNIYPFIGTDIKIMGKREFKNISLTLCVPLISKYVENIDDYNKKIGTVKQIVKDRLNTYTSKYFIDIEINTRDRENDDDLYMTLLGSALESGDEGSVGRGNRVHGVIPFTRNFTMEAACGKNPVYHIGKIYTAFAYNISKLIYETTGIENTVYITSQIGKSISNPWIIYIETNKDFNETEKESISEEVSDLFENPSEITKQILNRKITFC